MKNAECILLSKKISRMKLICTETKKEYAATSPVWRSDTGALLDLDFEASFDLTKIASRKPNLWRYREALPIAEDRHVLSFEEGFTPLLPVTLKGRTLYIKQEQLFPSGSYKDRGATVLMSHVKSLDIKHVVQDSSGNAGCAVAAYAAKGNISCDIYVPADTSPAKLAQIAMYGAGIHKIPGSREDTANAAFTAASQSYYASHCWNPFFFHGTKTFAYEVCEQLGWKAPQAVVLPAGNGTLLLGCYIGFLDLMKAGIINHMPKIIAIQAANCAPLFHAFEKGLPDIEQVPTSATIAEGIAITKPVRAKQMLAYVRDSGGMFLQVTEEEMEASLRLCVSLGFYIEPTSAAAVAGAMKYMEGFPGEEVVTLFSGHGLKSTEKMLKLLAH